MQAQACTPIAPFSYFYMIKLNAKKDNVMRISGMHLSVPLIGRIGKIGKSIGNVWEISFYR